MKAAMALGVALVAFTVTAAAQPAPTRVIVRHHGAEMNPDADGDGWITRAEAAALAERMFNEMDRDDDGRLTPEDRATHIADADVMAFAGEDGERVRIIRRGGSGERDEATEREIEREIERARRSAEAAAEDAERAQRDAEAALEDAERAAGDAGRHVERVVIIQGGGEWTQRGDAVAPAPPTPPVAPVAPTPPMFMMLIANSEEADLNGDGALSREEFRAQHLRFFDASDANGDGRVRFREPPAAPEPPAPPEPPRRR